MKHVCEAVRFYVPRRPPGCVFCGGNPCDLCADWSGACLTRDCRRSTGRVGVVNWQLKSLVRLSPRAAPRHFVSTRRAPRHRRPRLVRVRNPQRLLPRTDAGAAAACAAGLRPPPTRPAAWEAGSGCKFLYRETKRKAGPQPSPPGPIYLVTTFSDHPSTPRAEPRRATLPNLPGSAGPASGVRPRRRSQARPEPGAAPSAAASAAAGRRAPRAACRRARAAPARGNSSRRVLDTSARSTPLRG